MASSQEFDFIVIGAGIAGASIAAELAGSAKVALLEMESQPGYHTTGRSAAIFAPVYGPAPIRALTRASEAFFQTPPDGFTKTPMFSPRATLMIAREDQAGVLDAMMAELGDDPTVERLDAAAAHEVQPMLRDGYAMGAVFDQKGQDIDVHALHHGYLGMFRRAGGVLVCKAEVTGLQRQAGVWQVEAGGERYQAPVVVNAAGAWADLIGAMAGAEMIGLVPKRRTALMVRAPEGIATGGMPITADIEEQFYLKPDAGRLLISPANEDVDVPGDVQPDEMDVAICIDRVEKAFDLDVRRIESKWAGLRSFVADGVPVVGLSTQVEGFLWLAGQGGYGIQSAPATSRFGAAIVLGAAVPRDILEQGLNPDDLQPGRIGAGA